MQILAGLMQALRLQHGTLAIEALPASVCSLETLSFSVECRTGARALRIRELRVSLEEERLVHLDPGCGEFMYWTTAVRSVMPLPPMELAPHGTARVPVELPLPALEPSAALRRYRLLVIADAAGVNPQASALVAVAEAISGPCALPPMPVDARAS